MTRNTFRTAVVIIFQNSRLEKHLLRFYFFQEHYWTTKQRLYPLPSEEENCRLVQISDDDINSVVKSIPKLDTLILIKKMLKNHSFQNPFLTALKENTTGGGEEQGAVNNATKTIASRISRLERFSRAGRSNSAPGDYEGCER